MAQFGVELQRIAAAMSDMLQDSRSDEGAFRSLLESLSEVWARGVVFAAPVAWG